MAFDKTTVIQNAQKFTIKGQIDKAIEEWQKIVKESPGDGNTLNTIGDLYLKKNDNSEAIASYLKAAKAFDSAGFSLKTIAVYKKIIKIDPENTEIQIKMADLDAERGLIGNAIEEYLKVVRRFSKSGLHKEAIAVYKKIINLDPNNIQMRLMLASLCEKEKAKNDAVEQYIQIALLHRNQGKILEAEDVIKRAVILEPGNAQARQIQKEIESSDPSLPGVSLRQAPESAGLTAKAGIRNEPVSFREFSMTDDDVNDTRQEEIPSPVPDGAAAETAVLSMPDLQGENRLPDIPEMLIEAEVYVDQKLLAPSIELIRKILDRDPANAKAQQLLMRIHEMKESRPVEPPVVPDPLPEAAPAPEDATPAIFQADIGEPEAFDPSLANTGTLEALLPGEAAVSADSPDLDDQKIREKLAEGEFYSQQGLLSEAKIIYETVLEYAPENGLARKKLAEIEQALNETPPEPAETFEQLFSGNGMIPDAGPSGEANPPPATATSGTSFTPGTVKVKTTVLDKTDQTDFVNLIGELEGEFQEEFVAPADDAVQEEHFSKIIKEFQKGIQANIGEKDFETHFDLGVAYKEMGLRTEAIGEFQISIKGGPRAVDSAILLSKCYLEEGLPKLAVDQLTQAIGMNQLNHDQIHSLKYELAEIFENQENLDEALNVYSDIFKENVNYRDVSKKISAIRQKSARKA